MYSGKYTLPSSIQELCRWQNSTKLLQIPKFRTRKSDFIHQLQQIRNDWILIRTYMTSMQVKEKIEYSFCPFGFGNETCTLGGISNSYRESNNQKHVSEKKQVRCSQENPVRCSPCQIWKYRLHRLQHEV